MGMQSFFPTRGLRVPSGMFLRSSYCGNYHNATTDLNNRVNILHIHRDVSLLKYSKLTFKCIMSSQ